MFVLTAGEPLWFWARLILLMIAAQHLMIARSFVMCRHSVATHMHKAQAHIPFS